MRFTTSTTLLALASYALAASTPQLPMCAQLCFLKAVSETSCSISDYYVCSYCFPPLMAGLD